MLRPSKTEACRHRFDDSWLGRREWEPCALVDPSKPWRSRFRQTVTTLRRWRAGTCKHRSIPWQEVAVQHPQFNPNHMVLDIAGDVLAG
jgi:hypothetical protein